MIPLFLSTTDPKINTIRSWENYTEQLIQDFLLKVICHCLSKECVKGVSLYKKRGVTKFSNQYNLFKTIYSYLTWKIFGGRRRPTSGCKVQAITTIILIYRIYEAKDGRAKLLCYDNSEGRIGSSGLVGQRKTYAIWGYKLKKRLPVY